MATVLEDMIFKSRLVFLEGVEFDEITPERYFSRRKMDLGNGWKQFFIVLGPNIESPIHNHRGQNMEETHLLLYGSGKFIIYDEANNPRKEIALENGKLHDIFSTPTKTPNHKYVAGQEGSITLAFERHY